MERESVFRKEKPMKNVWLGLIAVTLFFSCDLFNGGEEHVLASQFLLTDPDGITLVGDTVQFYEENGDTAAKVPILGKKVKDIGYDVVLAAMIDPVDVGGYIVQANDIVISGNKAYIAYNYAGEPFKGAVQVVDISKKGEPEIIDELLLPSMDVNALYVDGNKLLFGGAANPDVWGFKSFIGRINTDDMVPDSIASSITALPSHAVTGIAKKGDAYWVTTGAADGKLAIISKSLTDTATIDLPDGRDIDEYRDGVIMIAGTTDNDATTGKVVLVSANDTSRQEIPVPDFGSDYHKATIEVFEGTTALLALSEAGFKVMDLTDGTIIYEAANPDMADGLPYTNSVSSDSDLIFSANGEWGFRVFSVQNKQFNATTVAGYYPFEGLTDAEDKNYSANHVEYKSGHLFVAAGVGGVQIFTLDKK
jgi:hypothetical protein